MTKDLEKENQELKEKLESLQGLIDIVAHDIRSPLTLIASSLDVIELIEEKENKLDDTTRNFLKRIKQNQKFANKLVKDILDMGRTENGLAYHPKSYSVTELLSNVVEDTKLAAKDKNITVKLDFHSEESVFCDRDRFKQIIDNLVGNAIKVSKKDTTITVRVWSDYNSDLGLNGAFVSVKDEGYGIPKEKLHSIFEKYQQLDTAAKILGVGLGLTIVKKFVQMHRGEVIVESEEGVGTTFTVFFPNEFEVKDISRNKDIERKLKVLVVDDDDDIREFITDGISDLPIILFEASDGVEALEVCRAQDPDVVFCDVQMPHMDGLELLQKFRHINCKGDFYLLSGANDLLEETMLKGDIGVTKYLPKPVTDDQLIEAIELKTKELKG